MLHLNDYARSPVVRLCAALVLVALLTLGVSARGTARHPTSPHAWLAALHPRRTIFPRTSVPVEYGPCTLAEMDSTYPLAVCPGVDGLGLGRKGDVLEGDIARLEDGEPNADVLHTGALLRVMSGAGPVEIEEAIDQLHRALPTAADPAAVMVDLSAAYLVLAGYEQTVDPVMYAFEWSDSAAALQPRSPAALFNRAVALDWLTADSSAVAAWRQYLRAEPRSAWSPYAEGRAKWLALDRTVVYPDSNATDQQLTRFAVLHRAEAREFGWDTLLQQWASAVLADDVAIANDRLHRASVLGDALQRAGGDASLADYTRILRTGVDQGRGVTRLARQHEVESERPCELLRRADIPGPHASWVGIKCARLLINAHEFAAASRVLSTLQVDTLRYPAVAGWAAWLRGTWFQRQGTSAPSFEHYHAAERMFKRAREQKNRGGAQWLVSDADVQVGRFTASYAWLRRAITTLRPVGNGRRRHDVMMALSRAALLEQLPRTAMALAAEDVHIAIATKKPDAVAEAHANRAEVLARSERPREALREADEVWRDSTGVTGFEDYFNGVTAYVRGLALLSTAPDSARTEFRTLVALNRPGFAAWGNRGRAQMAHASVLAGDRASAAEQLDSLFVALDRGRGVVDGASPRQVENDVRTPMLRLVRMLAAAGENERALDYLERGSAALSAVRVTSARVKLPVRPGRVVVRLLLASDTVYAWTVSGSTISLTRTAAPAAQMQPLLRSVNVANAGARDWRAERGGLYSLLIQPIENRIRNAREVVFVTDAELSGIPFGALADPAGTPLMVNHTVFSALTVASAATARPAPPPERITFIAPDFNPDLNPGLAPLAGARAEAESLSRATDTVQKGGTADSAAVDRALRNSSVLHFGGHAVSFGTRPERSYLVLAPGAGTPDGHYTAAHIEGMDLSGLRLVVLSACTSLGRDRGTSGLTGLSGALLGAGAGGVVGSLWKVNDRATRELMTEFYTEYRKTGDPAAALRHAQSVLYRRGRPAAEWAAFQYVAG